MHKTKIKASNSTSCSRDVGEKEKCADCSNTPIKYGITVFIVPKLKHTTIKRKNNGIERQNLNLRTHLKRLNRRTIHYSKSLAMLLAVVNIYFWGCISQL